MANQPPFEVMPNTQGVAFKDRQPVPATGDNYILDLLELRREEACVVPPSSSRRIEGTDGRHILVSDSFLVCSAMLFPAYNGGTNVLAHAHPMDSSSILDGFDPPGRDVFIIKGTEHSPLALEAWMALRGVRRRVLCIQTGDDGFGVGWNVRTGVVSVVRRTPDRSIFRFKLLAFEEGV